MTGETLSQFLARHAAAKPVSFHMPGHKGAAIYRENGYGSFLDDLMNWDITEIPGADNLFQPESVLAQVMTRYAKLYDVEQSYLLVNGSSGGLIAAILAAVGRGGKLIMARNCHKSIFNALVLGDIEPVYARPEVIAEYGIQGAISPAEIARCIAQAPDATAVILPSPNYYGICSDIAAIAEVCHQAGKTLIVDEAHGAHLRFFQQWAADGGYPLPAEAQGADAVIVSIHKTLASFTQTAALHLCSDRIDRHELENCLQMLESSSPSYPLMVSLEVNADLLERRGAALIHQWRENIDWFYAQAAKLPGLRVMSHPLLDRTKLNLDLSACGLDGNALETALMKRGIFVELVTGNIVMAMTGIGNRREDYVRLIDALQEIAAEAEITVKPNRQFAMDKNRPLPAQPPQPAALTLRLRRGPVPAQKVWIPIDEAAGRICAAAVIPYPPGIPIICPGEIYQQEIIDYVKACRAAGEKVIGIDSAGRVACG